MLRPQCWRPQSVITFRDRTFKEVIKYPTDRTLQVSSPATSSLTNPFIPCYLRETLKHRLWLYRTDQERRPREQAKGDISSSQ